MRYLAVPLALLIIGLVFLLYVWTDRRRVARRDELRRVREQNARAVHALEVVEKDIKLQMITGQFNLQNMEYLHDVVCEQIHAILEPDERKELIP